MVYERTELSGGKTRVAGDGLVHLCLELHSRSFYCSLLQEDNLILLFQKAPVLYMTLAGMRLPSGINKGIRKNATSKLPLEDLSVSREMNSRHSQTRGCSFFSLSQEVWLGVFKSVHFTVHFFFFFSKEEDWHLYSDHRDVAFQNSKSET